MSPPARLDTSGIEVLSFDCYGTIIDWDGGIAAAFAAVPAFRDQDLPALVAEREEIEKHFLAEPYRPYRDILRASLQETAARHGLSLSRDDLDAFAASMPTWPPFPDSTSALLQLQRHGSLAILSNVEREVLDASLAPLERAGVRFSAKITADRVHSYKPARAHFDAALAELELSASSILHVAGSRYHDIDPAAQLGWRAVFVDRRGDGGGAGTPTVRSLAELARSLGS